MRLIRTYLFLLPLVLTGSAALAAPATMFVLDASTPMLTKIGNRTKLDIAKSAIDIVMKSAPVSLTAGVTAFGHRNKTSCTDVEVGVTAATRSASDIAEFDKKIVPVGKTSLVAAVKIAAQSLDYENQPANVIAIVSAVDGCAADPCALGTELKAFGSDIRVSVITLGLTAQQARPLACLPQGTGGTFANAANSEELVSALDKAIKVVPDGPVPSASIKAPAKVESGSTFKVEWTGPKDKGDVIQLAWPAMKAGQSIRSFLAKADGKPGSMMAPDARGQYEIRYYQQSADRVLARQTIDIADIQVRIEMPDKAAQGATFSLVWKGPTARGDTVEIVKASGGAALAVASIRQDTGEATLDAPPEPGSYLVRMRSAGDPNPKASKPLNVTALDIKLEAPAQIAGGGEFAVKWQGPGSTFDEIEIAAPDMPDNRRIQAAVIDQAGKPVTLEAPAQGGDFVLRYRSGKYGVVLKKVTIRVARATASVDGPADVDGGARFEVTWKGPGGRNDEIGIAPLNAPPGRDSTFALIPTDGSAVTLDAPVAEGDYEIRYWSARSRQVLASKRIRVKKPTVTLQVAAGAIKAGKPFAVSWTGPGSRYDDIRVGLPATDGEQALRSSLLAGAGKPVTLLAPEKPGTYLLRYWSAKTKTVLASVTLRVE